MNSRYQLPLAELAGGAVLLTGSNRLARHLREQYDWQQARHHKTWPSAQIYSWRSWLELLWQQLAEERWRHQLNLPMQLSSAQELVVWENLIRDSEFGSALLQVRATARRVMSSWQLVNDYQLDWRKFDTSDVDVRGFKSWCSALAAKLQAENWLTSAQVPTLLFENRTLLQLPAKFFSAGFEQPTQSQHQWFGWLSEQSQLTELKPHAEASSAVTKVECDSSHAELNAFAAWSEQLLKQTVSEQTDTNELGRLPSIGLVVPDLAGQSAQIHRQLSRHFAAQQWRDGATPTGLFDVSLGEPLADQSMVASALAALQWLAKPIQLQQLSSLWLSPWLMRNRSDLVAHSRLDETLRGNGRDPIQLKDVAFWARQLQLESVADQLDTIREAFEAHRNQKLSAEQWAPIFDRLLKLWGWPGPRVLSSVEYQTLSQWRACLRSFSRLTLLGEQLTFNAALARLKQQASETLFKPESPKAPIQVMGLLEAVGLEFDALWVMGLNDDALPRPATPDPFIPIAIQVAKQMPSSSPEHELQFAQTILGGLLDNSEQAVVSYASIDGDLELLPSPLIEHYPSADHGQHQADAYAAKNWSSMVPELAITAFSKAPELEQFSEDSGPAIETGEARGGTGLFKSQAQCPFQAFARYRLRASSLETVEPGLDAAARGSLVHLVMAAIWQRLETSPKLLSFEPDALRQLVDECVASVLAEFARRTNAFDQRAFLDLEQQRLRDAALQALALDRKRGAFRVVGTEQKHDITVGPLTIRTYIDRVDQTDAGERLIIDYKTGKTSRADLKSETLKEPQLPIYAFGYPDVVDGVFFASLKPGEYGYLGRSNSPDLFNRYDAVEDWQQQINEWQEKLNQLADDFASGVAIVDPVDKKVCNYCDLKPLCRLHEKYGNLLGHDPDDGSAPGDES